MPPLLQPDVITHTETLGVKARTIVEGLRVGDHRSPFRGFSIEFVQHREYVPGDDTRHIDWKSYGRSERYTIKQYEQETNFVAHILFDASRSMLYGEGDSNKLEYGKVLAASLAYLVIHQRDSAALSVFDAGWRTRLPASGQPGHLLTVLRTLEDTQPQEKTAIGPLLEDLAQQVKRRGLVFLISDCFDQLPSLLKGLRHLRFKGHEVTIFHVLHPDEIGFPFEGMVKFDPLEDGRVLLTRPHLIRPAYLRAVQAYLEEFRTGCEANRCDYVLMDTSRPLAETLTEYLARRQRVKGVQTMSFLAPYMLWGALAGGIPIALHFFYRSRYRTVPWAAMQFLLTSIEQTSRRLRFQEMLLLALRVTVLVLLALALARPSTIAGHASSGGEAVDAVLLLDNSFSMGARDGVLPPREAGADPYLAALKALAGRDGSVTRLDRARAATLAVIDSLPPGSTVQVVTCSDRADLLGPQTPSRLDQARELVRQVQVSDLATDLMPGVIETDTVLQRGHSPNRELYLFSDMQRLGWEQQGSSLAVRLKELRLRATLHLVHCGNRAPANAAIVGITPQSSLRVGERADFAVLVRNTSKQELRNLTVTLEVDGRSQERDSRPLDKLAPGATEDVVLSVPLDQPGRRALTARVAADDLDADNRFDQVIQVRDEVGVLIVDGGLAENDDRQSDSFRLRLALAPFPAQAIAPDRVSPKMLANKELCILVNVALEPTAKKDTRVLPPEFVDALAGFVRDGHSVIVFGGPNVTPEPYNRMLYQQHRLLPFPIGSVGSAPADRPLSFDRQSAAASPYLKLREEYYSGAEQGRVLRWLVLQEGERPAEGDRSTDEARVLLRYSNGQTAIASRRKAGEGEVLMLTTAVHDRTVGKGTTAPEWTDWYSEPRLWVPLIQMTANHLLESQPRQYNRIAGQPLRWSPPRSDAESAFDLILPDGTTTRLGFPETVEGRPVLTANDTRRAGVYYIARTDRAPLGDEPTRAPAAAGETQSGVPFAVVPDLRESEDLVSLQPKELDDILGFQAVHLKASDEGGVFSAAERLKREWTVWLLVGLLVLVIGEALLGLVLWTGVVEEILLPSSLGGEGS